MDPQEFYINDKELKIKPYRRNIFGTVFLSIVLTIGVVLFVARYYMIMVMQPSSWAYLGKYFVPPVQYIVFLLLLQVGPDEHIDGMCLFGRIIVPIACYAFSAFILYMAWVHECWLEMAFYVLMTAVQTVYFLPEISVLKVVRPFVRRPEEEIQAERDEKIRSYKMQ